MLVTIGKRKITFRHGSSVTRGLDIDEVQILIDKYGVAPRAASACDGVSKPTSLLWIQQELFSAVAFAVGKKQVNLGEVIGMLASKGSPQLAKAVSQLNRSRRMDAHPPVDLPYWWQLHSLAKMILVAPMAIFLFRFLLMLLIAAPSPNQMISHLPLVV